MDKKIRKMLNQSISEVFNSKQIINHIYLGSHQSINFGNGDQSPKKSGGNKKK